MVFVYSDGVPNSTALMRSHRFNGLHLSQTDNVHHREHFLYHPLCMDNILPLPAVGERSFLSSIQFIDFDAMAKARSGRQAGRHCRRHTMHDVVQVFYTVGVPTRFCACCMLFIRVRSCVDCIIIMLIGAERHSGCLAFALSKRYSLLDDSFSHAWFVVRQHRCTHLRRGLLEQVAISLFWGLSPSSTLTTTVALELIGKS